LLRAITEFRAAGRPLALASALEDAGLLGRATGNAETLRWFKEALSIATSVGAVLARQRLEVLVGTRGATASAGSRSASCLPELSPAERRVAMEVAVGKTNIEVAETLYISRHTVDAHLRTIFAKLGVRRRSELSARVTRECGPVITGLDQGLDPGARS
ncbi:helix-turn-helix transcriptional regulator, partial [Actinoplanes italicus]